MTINLSYYKRQIEKLKTQIMTNTEGGNKSEVNRLNKEISNYEKFIAQREVKPTGVDKYLK